MSELNEELKCLNVEFKNNYLTMKSKQNKIYGLKLDGTINGPPKLTKYNNYMLCVSLDAPSVNKLDLLFTDLERTYQHFNITKELKKLYIVNDFNVPTLFLYFNNNTDYALNLVEGLNKVNLKVFCRGYKPNEFKFKFRVSDLTYKPTDEPEFDIDFD